MSKYVAGRKWFEKPKKRGASLIYDTVYARKTKEQHRPVSPFVGRTTPPQRVGRKI